MRRRDWKAVVRAAAFAAVLAANTVWLVGCATPQDSESLSERPWNTPQQWEHGLPSIMTEGR
ncbi:MAG: hypothetical protein J7M29_04255 [Verrucomicrobia bacterium]|nr:hypothetical protein [Verrucomicrobiota bacterium]